MYQLNILYRPNLVSTSRLFFEVSLKNENILLLHFEHCIVTQFLTFQLTFTFSWKSNYIVLNEMLELHW